jgi:type II secretory pathway pseudopilin PulG
MKTNQKVNMAIVGLSVTELILVVLIVAILATILVSVSFNILEKARITADQANARLLYQATAYYATLNGPTTGAVDPAVLSPYIGGYWPTVMSTIFAGHFLCKIDQDGKIIVSTGSAVYDPASGHLLKS